MPTFHYPRIAVIFAALLSIAAGSAVAASSASSASSAVSDSIGSSSTSLEKSSNSSSNNKEVAQGTYTVIEAVALADDPTMLQLQLQPQLQSERESSKLSLKLPRETAERAGIAAGSFVHVAHRPYGLAFSTGTTEATPFFLVLNDDWYQELRSRPVIL